jgi:hypothetical protein
MWQWSSGIAPLVAESMKTEPLDNTIRFEAEAVRVMAIADLRD